MRQFVRYIINKMPAILALRVMLGLIHLFQLYASPIDKTILANEIQFESRRSRYVDSLMLRDLDFHRKCVKFYYDNVSFSMTSFQSRVVV